MVTFLLLAMLQGQLSRLDAQNSSHTKEKKIPLFLLVTEAIWPHSSALRVKFYCVLVVAERNLLLSLALPLSPSTPFTERSSTRACVREI